MPIYGLNLIYLVLPSAVKLCAIVVHISAIADPLGFPLATFYYTIYRRLSMFYDTVSEFSNKNKLPLQPLQSNACALYCLYIAHNIFGSGRKKHNSMKHGHQMIF